MPQKPYHKKKKNHTTRYATEINHKRQKKANEPCHGNQPKTGEPTIIERVVQSGNAVLGHIFWTVKDQWWYVDVYTLNAKQRSPGTGPPCKGHSLLSWNQIKHKHKSLMARQLRPLTGGFLQGVLSGEKWWLDELTKGVRVKLETNRNTVCIT